MTTLEDPEPILPGDPGSIARQDRPDLVTVPTDAFVADPLKTARPLRRPGQVERPDLVASLTTATDCKLVLVTAPTGYGKSTSLAQWADTDPRVVVWLSVDHLDDDPVWFLRHLVLSLDLHQPVADDIAEPLMRATPPIHTVVLPRLGRALLARTSPMVLIIDDAHLVHSRDTLDCLRAVLDHLPTGSTLVLSGRSTPDLPLGRLRLHHQLAEFGSAELAMTLPEAESLMLECGVELSPLDLRDLHDQTEGWPAGLALAALAATGDGSPEISGFGGDHRLVADYLHEELLAGLPAETSAFLTRASVLPRLSGPLCDAVLETTGSGLMLERLARSKNLFVVPLDDTGGWYRFHHLFADLLRADLHAQDPATERDLHLRASKLAEHEGDLDGAIRHAAAAAAIDRAADLMLGNALIYGGRGRNATVGLWLDLFDDDVVRSQPRLALAMALHQFGLGHLDVVGYWADVAEQAARQAGPDVLQRNAVAIAAIRALPCAPGIGHMHDFTGVVRAAGREGNDWWGLATLLEGVATMLMGDADAGRALLLEAAQATTHLPHAHAVALSQLAYIEMHEGNWNGASGLVAQARKEIDRNGLAEYPPVVAVYAVASLVRAHAGDVESARRDVQQARHLLSVVGPVVVRTNLQAYALLARAELLLGDRVAARTLADEAALLVTREPLARTALDDLRLVEQQLAQIEPADDSRDLLGPSSLTTAELRVLEFLPTHLSLKEIGEKLFVSRNTVKSQAIATYRKLGVSSRGEAVVRARSLGLIEP